MAEDECLVRGVGRRAEQPLVVGVAADDAVQNDDVGGLDGCRIAAMSCSRRSTRSSSPASRASRAASAVVGRRELEVHRARGAALEQLELDLADAAADLEHRRPSTARARRGSRPSAARSCRGRACGSAPPSAARSGRRRGGRSLAGCSSRPWSPRLASMAALPTDTATGFWRLAKPDGAQRTWLIGPDGRASFLLGVNTVMRDTKVSGVPALRRDRRLHPPRRPGHDRAPRVGAAVERQQRRLDRRAGRTASTPSAASATSTISMTTTATRT